LKKHCEQLFAVDNELNNEHDILNTQYRKLILEIVHLQKEQKSVELKVLELEQGFARQREIIAQQEKILTEVEKLLDIESLLFK
jgi:cell division protein FtsL